MHSLPKCIKTGKKRPEFFSKYKGALYSLPPFKLLFLHIFVYSQFCLLENSSFHVLGQTKSPLPVNANAIGRINSPIPVTSCIKSVSSYTSILQSTKKDIFLSFFDIFFSFFFCSIKISEGGNLAASKIRNLECPSYEICLIDYGCGKFNRKIHIMEQYP